MIEIKDLLLKFSKFIDREGDTKNLIAEILSDSINFNIKTEDLEIKNGIVFLNIKPIYKNEIFFKKKLIIENFKNTLGKRAPYDIR